ncbi:MAG: NOL1/NOP2/sun family putative RNA methylase [Calditrichia bacterium]
MARDIHPELEKMFTCLLGDERHHMLDTIGEKLPSHFRFNPIKGALEDQQNFFREQGFDFKAAVEGRDDIYELTVAPYSVGRSLSHFLGHIYIQDIASMIPPIALDPQPGDWVLDMSAAPGSKTTQMASMMQNQGVILANDISSKRLRALSYNLQRWGVVNTMLYRWYGEQFGNGYFETFDRILVDPGCSGLGTLHKNPEVLGWWTPEHGDKLADSQRNQIASAIKALRPGGVLTYSTCTVDPRENEGVIDYALKNFPVEIEPLEVDGIRTWPGVAEYDGTTYHPDVVKTVRCYPLERMTEGFYIAKLRKTDGMREPDPNRRKSPREMNFHSHNSSEVKRSLKYLTEHFGIPKAAFKNYLYQPGRHIYFIGKGMQEFVFRGEPLQVGTKMAYRMDRGMKLSTEGCHLLGDLVEKAIIDLPDLATVEQFVNRHPIDTETEGRGQVLIRYNKCVIGYGIYEGTTIKSQFPKGDWQFSVTPKEDLPSED